MIFEGLKGRLKGFGAGFWRLVDLIGLNGALLACEQGLPVATGASTRVRRAGACGRQALEPVAKARFGAVHSLRQCF